MLNRKRIISSITAAAVALSLMPVASLADSGRTVQTAVNVAEAQQSGRLLISEPGTYTLTGSMRGSVCVDPGAGDVTLIMDNVDIDGGDSAGIMALSGDSLTIRLADSSMNSVTDGGMDAAHPAAIWSSVDTWLEGSGALQVTGTQGNGIDTGNASLTVRDGSWMVSAAGAPFSGGSFSIDGGWVVGLGQSVAQPAGGQSAIGAELTGSIAQDSRVALRRADGQTAITFAAPQPFGAMLVSTPQLTMGSYGVYTEGQLVQQLPMETMTQGEYTALTRGGQRQQQRPADAVTQPTQSTETQPAQTQPTQGETGRMSRFGQRQGQTGMPGDVQEGMGGQLPGMQGSQQSTGSATEIVTSTAQNTAADLEADYENATTIVMSDEDSQVKISDSGTYIVTGSASDGNITVKKGTTGVVLVLSDLDLTSTNGATLSVNKEAEVKIIVSGNVTLTDNENPDDEYSTDTEVADAYDGAAMKFKANSQVYLTGDGTLNIVGQAKNGIKAGDESSLIVDGVTLNITSANDGINSNYDLTVLSGKVTIQSGDDAIHADHILTLGNADGTGPEVNIQKSTEGLEATVVNLFGGHISVRSTDDAINAANSDGLYEGELAYSINMTGGTVTIVSSGDGMDSNGNINLVGGSLSIQSASMGGESGIDYDGQYYISSEMGLNNLSGTAGPDQMMGMMGQQGQMMGQQGQMMGRQGQMMTEQGQIMGQQGQMMTEQGQMMGQQGRLVTNSSEQ